MQVVNCVGLMNYKFFLQFLLYTFVATVVAIVCLIQPMLTFFSGNPGSRCVHMNSQRIMCLVVLVVVVVIGTWPATNRSCHLDMYSYSSAEVVVVSDCAPAILPPCSSTAALLEG